MSREQDFLKAYMRADEELKRIDALRPPCPTCGGKATVVHILEDGKAYVTVSCPDCPPDGKVPIERLVRFWVEAHP